MNLGNVDCVSAPRRVWTRQVGAMGVAVALGVFGLVGVHRTEGRADASSSALAAGEAVVDLPVPPPRLVTPEVAEPPAVITAPPVETTVTAPPPVETTTTTTVAAAPPAPPAPATDAPRTAPVKSAAAATGPRAQAEVEAIADSSGWDWRAAGVRFAMGFYPADCCHWGIYEAAGSTIWVGPTAFEDGNRLRYVVLHELAHAWQYRQNRFAEIIDDYTAWGFATIGPALEAGADCLANVWGAAGGHYWSCPAAARALTARRFAGDWR